MLTTVLICWRFARNNRRGLSMKTILFLCGAKKSYVRNAMNLKMLKKNAKVIEISSNARSYYLRFPLVLLRFIFCHQKYDLVFVGFLGQTLMPFVKLRTKKPIIFDAFISLYDTLCFDRKIFRSGSLIGKLVFWLDKKSCQWAYKIINDTNTHADYFSKTFNIKIEKIQTIYLGADTDIFYPRSAPKNNDKFIVFYYGSGLSLQGIDIILKAAKIIEKNEKIVFQLVGPIRKKYKSLINHLKLKNVEFTNWISYRQLPEKISKANLCLGGHFSNIDKAKRVISGKTYQFLAMKKPTIVGDNPANRELFEHKKNVYMARISDPQSLADEILELNDNPQLAARIAENGYESFNNIMQKTALAFSGIFSYE